MPKAKSTPLKPRKRPQQARAAVTLNAIFEATIQLLVSTNIADLTTTRIAERAGVSVGTMYQYFPNKQALIYSLNERYLDNLADKIEAVCSLFHGERLGDMAEALIDAYWQAKTEREDVTRALYRSVVALDNDALVAGFTARAEAATLSMFASASDAQSTNIASASRLVITAVFGSVRSAFEFNRPGFLADDFRQQLVIMCRSYLQIHGADARWR